MSVLTICFYAVFISQVFLLSYYYPKKLYNRVKFVLDNYPPEEYPKLYPMLSPELATYVSRKGLSRYRSFNAVTLAIGVALITAALIKGVNAYTTEEVVIAAYAMLQFAPIIWLSISELRHLNLMRMANRSTKRTSTLQSRGLFDFVSRPFVALALVLIAANLGLDLYIAADRQVWDNDLLIKLASTNLVHFVAAGVMAFYLLTGKRNPLQDPKDRMTELQILVKSSIICSVAASVFFISNTSLDLFDAAYLDPLIMSIYFQAAGEFSLGLMLRSQPVEAINFDVYKETPVS